MILTMNNTTKSFPEKHQVEPETYTIRRMALLLDGKPEVTVKGGRIDVLTSIEVVEVERLATWRQGLSQVVFYGKFYPEKKKRLHLLVPQGKTIAAEKQREVENEASEKGVVVTWEYETLKSKDFSFDEKLKIVGLLTEKLVELENKFGKTHPEVFRKVADELIRDVFPRAKLSSYAAYLKNKSTGISMSPEELHDKILEFAKLQRKPVSTREVLRKMKGGSKLTGQQVHEKFKELHLAGKGRMFNIKRSVVFEAE